ncbi:hypothetical protein Anapl_03781 [Anas platyrhynchos]|uniref:Uncharacterized protein n=1 Tax=Anas platyrhynchos TaxID=8839 RepID=R0M0T9_ANAPL|nr:hypothetical protein Anapl_03781 [Anas platyrhynchos]
MPYTDTKQEVQIEQSKHKKWSRRLNDCYQKGANLVPESAHKLMVKRLNMSGDSHMGFPRALPKSQLYAEIRTWNGAICSDGDDSISTSITHPSAANHSKGGSLLPRFTDAGPQAGEKKLEEQGSWDQESTLNFLCHTSSADMCHHTEDCCLNAVNYTTSTPVQSSKRTVTGELAAMVSYSIIFMKVPSISAVQPFLRLPRRIGMSLMGKPFSVVQRNIKKHLPIPGLVCKMEKTICKVATFLTPEKKNLCTGSLLVKTNDAPVQGPKGPPHRQKLLKHLPVHALDVNQDKDGYGDKSLFICFAEKEAQLQQQKFPVVKNLEQYYVQIPHMMSSFSQLNEMSLLLEGQRLQVTLCSHSAALCVFEMHECESSCFGVVTLETARFLEALIGEEVPVTLDEGMN